MAPPDEQTDGPSSAPGAVPGAGTGTGTDAAAEPAADRDRNAAGRAEQARPRDRLGRPLAYGEPGVEPISEDPRSPEDTLTYARELLDVGRPFQAHEALEVRWKSGPEDERELWQGLAQLCVGLTHHERGNAVGASRLLERAAGRLASYGASGGPTYELDLGAVVACARARIGSTPSGDHPDQGG
ncbi:DUF309 domain-containing protein [Nocardioides sp. HDW12B]|uniref:DUF309 domain-containing protein n=1 Tax=Nocardioides sp. HDW12B TaxID=2714939 RepID=UPI00140B81E9|nr:DUF309 domain-containing protein [Nocardioides sp. HDW12B]QIK68102.1 DUF309 domain-containing protein [Nocardioides sp. HDW12B]